MQGGESHASPPVGLQAPVLVLPVLSPLPEDAGTEEDDEGGGESTGEACTTAAWVEEAVGIVLTGDGAVVRGAVTG